MSDYSKLPCPPFVPIDGIANFRDAGGYAVADSTEASIRRGYLFRCGDPSLISAAGLERVRALGIRKVFDTRSQPEIDRCAVPRPFADEAGIEHVETPVFRAEDYSPEGIASRYRDYASGTVEGFTRAYAEVLRNAGPAVSTILSHIRDAPNEPLIVHCSAGKDRTGIAVALALKLAGCSEEVVSQEYAMTELSIAEQAKRAEALISQKIAEQPAEGEQSKKDDEPGDLRSQLLKAAGLSGKEADRAGGRLKARKEYMLSTLAYIRETYGGPEGYVRQQCGLSDADIAKIRTTLRAEGVPAVVKADSVRL